MGGIFLLVFCFVGFVAGVAVLCRRFLGGPKQSVWFKEDDLLPGGFFLSALAVFGFLFAVGGRWLIEKFVEPEFMKIASAIGAVVSLACAFFLTEYLMRLLIDDDRGK